MVENNNKNNVLQFGAIKKKDPVPEPPKVKGLDEYDKLDEELVAVIQNHTETILNGMIKYLVQQKILDPEKNPEKNFGDIVLIKESIISMLCRKANVDHDLQHLVDFNMKYEQPVSFDEPTQV